MATRRPASWTRRASCAPLLAAALALSPGCAEDDQFVAGASGISASPTRVDLGRVFVGASGQATVSLEVLGTVPVTFSARFGEGDASGFRAGPPGGVIAAGGTAELTVQFVPQEGGARQASLLIGHDASETEGDLEIELVALGSEPPDCEDGNGCTVDTFDFEAGVCRHEAVALPCDDFNACTQNDTCVEGVCLGESVSCDDDNVCTDDVCDPQQGCLHLETTVCDDGNPCTRDICDADGCDHENLDNGTPCDDFEQCTEGDICKFGRCEGVAFPDGFECDDLDPCSLEDQCIEGTCKDPNYRPVAPGELKFATRVGHLAAGAANNPIVDRDSAVLVGTRSGVARVDQCGRLEMTNDTLGTPTFGAAVSLPGLLSVPVGEELVDLDTTSLEEFRRLDLSLSKPLPVGTSSTATVTVTVLDMALRASGGIVVSLWRTVSDPPSAEGWLAEVDATHNVATLFRPLGARRAVRLAVDIDEAVIALIADGADGDVVRAHQIVRFGLAGLPETTWSSSPVDGVHSDLAIGPNSEVLWTAGLVSLSRTGTAALYRAAPTDPLALEAGAPALDRDRLYSVVRKDAPPEEGLGVLPGGRFFLEARTATTGASIYEVELPARAVRSSPAVDADGNVFVLLEDGRVVGYDVDGQPMMQLLLPLDGLVDEPIAVTLTPTGVLLVITQQTVFGVQSIQPLSTSAWPRHRRDNLSSGHR